MNEFGAGERSMPGPDGFCPRASGSPVEFSQSYSPVPEHTMFPYMLLRSVYYRAVQRGLLTAIRIAYDVITLTSSARYLLLSEWYPCHSQLCIFDTGPSYPGLNQSRSLTADSTHATTSHSYLKIQPHSSSHPYIHHPIPAKIVLLKNKARVNTSSIDCLVI
ncbi:hypothetical protein J6590_018671 [Homalodisca vitripennis]|nr:hypothetical protein J6590_018671 [Homalodisca vitripennis]